MTNKLYFIYYLSEDKLLIYGYRLSPSFAQLNSQVGADAVTHDASSRIPCVVADLTIHRVFKELAERKERLGFVCHTNCAVSKTKR